MERNRRFHRQNPSSNRNPGPTADRRAREEHDSDEPSDFPSIVGTCALMCPELERSQRERLRDLAIFESLHGNPRVSSPTLAVKKFCRTITRKEVRSSDVRPLTVLEETLAHLLSLLDSSEHPFEVVHDFIFDRTRSIRQDLSMQNIVNNRAISMYQEMVRFYVISHYRLRNRSSSSEEVSSLHYLNKEQLTKTLASLYTLYEANRISTSAHEHEPEFRSLYVLLNLHSNRQPMGESLSLWFCHVPSKIMGSKEMRFTRKILRFFRIGNYKRFLNAIVDEATYLQYCIIEPYVSEVRALGLSFINNCGYKLHPYPLAHLSKLLLMKESEMESFCKDCGLQTCTDEEGNKLLPTKQTSFCFPKNGYNSYSFQGSERFERNPYCGTEESDR